MLFLEFFACDSVKIFACDFDQIAGSRKPASQP